MTQARAVAAALLAAVGALSATAPSPARAVATLGQPPSADPTAPLVAALALLAWGLVGWLVVVLLTVAAGRVPGWAGRGARAVAARVAPAAVRRVVELALGITVATGALTAPHAVAEPTQPVRPALSLDWPGPGPTDQAPALDWPAATATPAPARPAATQPTPPEQPAPAAVVVRPGDTLWAIAAEHLPAGAAPAAIAQAWPAWWSANRAAIGGDPDLIVPGTPLVPPTR